MPRVGTSFHTHACFHHRCHLRCSRPGKAATAASSTYSSSTRTARLVQMGRQVSLKFHRQRRATAFRAPAIFRGATYRQRDKLLLYSERQAHAWLRCGRYSSRAWRDRALASPCKMRRLRRFKKLWSRLLSTADGLPEDIPIAVAHNCTGRIRPRRDCRLGFHLERGNEKEQEQCGSVADNQSDLRRFYNSLPAVHRKKSSVQQ